jgi:hypothetical protein
MNQRLETKMSKVNSTRNFKPQTTREGSFAPYSGNYQTRQFTKFDAFGGHLVRLFVILKLTLI